MKYVNDQMETATKTYVATNEAFRHRCLYESITLNFGTRLFQSLIEVNKKPSKEHGTYNTAYYQMPATFWGVQLEVDAKATVTDLPSGEYKKILNELLTTGRVPRPITIDNMQEEHSGIYYISKFRKVSNMFP